MKYAIRESHMAEVFAEAETLEEATAKYWLLVYGTEKEFGGSREDAESDHEIYDNEAEEVVDFIAEMSPREAYSIVLKTLAKSSGISQKEFANKLHVPLRTLEDWLAGKHAPNLFTMHHVLRTFHLF